MNGAGLWGDRETADEPGAEGRFSWMLRGASIDDIRVDGDLVLRAVRAVVRDSDWRTVPTRVASVERTADSLTLGLVADGLGAVVEWTVHLSVDGLSLQITAEGTAKTGFLRNRLGLVVLHPASVAGSNLLIRHPNGSVTETSFPGAVAPHQPARNIAGLNWSTARTDLLLHFTGDEFEMEDQRNWTDASFKTYSTPLALPFPVRVEAGDTVRQQVVLEATMRPGAQSQLPAPPIRTILDLHPGGRVLPMFAVGASTAPDGFRPATLPIPVLVELDLATRTWRSALTRARAEGAGIDARIVTSDPPRLDEALNELALLNPGELVRIGIFDPATHYAEPVLIQALTAGLRARGSTAPVVGGTRAHFTELNRHANQHTQETVLPGGIAFSVTPQMHDISRRQVVESVAMFGLVARDAVAFAAGSPVHVGPVTLRPRFNAVTTNPPTPLPDTDLIRGYGAEHVWASTDPRQRGDGYAAWLAAAAASLAIPGVVSITLAEASGARGFADADGEFPARRVLGWLMELGGAVALETNAELPDGAYVLAASLLEASGNNGVIVLAANLGDSPWELELLGQPTGSVESSVTGTPDTETGATVIVRPSEAVRMRIALAN